MKKNLLIFPILILMMSCIKTPEYIPIKSTEFVLKTVKDTVINIQLVPYKDSVIVKDTISLLENKYASTKAVWSEGFLTHTLSIKSNPIKVVIQKEKELRIDSVPVPYPVKGDTVYIKKKPTAWQIFTSIYFILSLIFLLGIAFFKGRY